MITTEKLIELKSQFEQLMKSEGYASISRDEFLLVFDKLIELSNTDDKKDAE